MKLHEHQAKTLLASVGVPVPRGRAVTTAEAAAEAYTALREQCRSTAAQAGNGTDGFVCNVKAQLHAGGGGGGGGRGKAGGIRVAHSAAEAVAQARELLGRRLVTHQTGPDGLPVSAVLVDERIAVSRELYLAVTIDRFRATLMVLASRHGGVDIEEVAVRDPQAIARVPAGLDAGLTTEAAQRITEALGCRSE